jgi:5-(carboxyamino)imidazole ribonucleotide synthase
MMIVPAVNLGIEIKVLSESEDSSASLATTAVGDYSICQKRRCDHL